jgi:ferrous iron transport protein B
LWVLANTAPSGAFEAVDANFTSDPITGQVTDLEHRAARSDASWAGELGRFIEPAIAPLGYDGRMGIALMASFAAREVFVGTMATLYAAEEDEPGISALQTRLARSGTLSPATALSLIVFYMFAMQCASTIAVVRRELDSWAWAIAQALGMTAIAWLAAFAAFNLAS